MLSSIVLAGGKGTRLADARKRLDRDAFRHLPAEAWGTVGPKALARMTATEAAGGPVGPAATATTGTMIEWHLAMHAADADIERVTMALGFGGELVRAHLGSRFGALELDYLIERHPAGTVAPLARLAADGRLPDGPTVYANGDNLMEVALSDRYHEGMALAERAGMNLDLLVVDLAAMVPWEESEAYGTLDWDPDSGRVAGFREKAPFTDNPKIYSENGPVTPINSGLSIINNPRALCAAYLADSVVEASLRLEAGELAYASHESQVKYETLYEHVAAEGNMLAVASGGYWTDLGTEQKIEEAERRLTSLPFANSLPQR